MTLDGHIIFTNISAPTGDGSEMVLMVFLQFRNGTLSRGITVNATFLAGTTLLCFQLMNDEVGTEDTSDSV